MNIDYEEKIALTQVYDVINFLEEEEREKIPKDFIKFIEANRSLDYISTINPYIPLELQKLEPQAQSIISYIFIKFLSNEDEKQEFKAREIKEYEEEKARIEQQCKNMFNDDKKEPEEIKEKTILPMVIEKENIFVKILNKIKSLFKRR